MCIKKKKKRPFFSHIYGNFRVYLYGLKEILNPELLY